MDFQTGMKLLSDRVIKLKGSIQTEEATKNALVMPFIQLLGYDIFNPMEVIPEFTADVGIKKGEKHKPKPQPKPDKEPKYVPYRTKEEIRIKVPKIKEKS